MKRSGKENTLPFQVISRAMESVVNQNRLDMNALIEAARQAPLPGVPHSGEGASGSAILKENEMAANQLHASGGEASGRSAHTGPCNVTVGTTDALPRHEVSQADDTRSQNSHNVSRHDSVKYDERSEKTKNTEKRKRQDPRSTSDLQENPKSDTANSRKWKQAARGAPRVQIQPPSKGGDQDHMDPVHGRQSYPPKPDGVGSFAGKPVVSSQGLTHFSSGMGNIPFEMQKAAINPRGAAFGLWFGWSQMNQAMRGNAPQGSVPGLLRPPLGVSLEDT